MLLNSNTNLLMSIVAKFDGCSCYILRDKGVHTDKTIQISLLFPYKTINTL